MKFVFSILFISALLGLFACSEKSAPAPQFTQSISHYLAQGKYAKFNISAPADSSKLSQDLSSLSALLAQTEQRYSPHGPLLQSIANASVGTRIPLQPNDWTIFDFALLYREYTHHQIDPGVGNLIAAWKISWQNDSAQVPADSTIQRLVKQLQIAPYTLDSAQQQLLVQDSGRHIALGAYLEGFLLQKASALLDSLKYPSYLVEVSGDFVFKGPKPDGSPWRLGVKNPFDSEELAFVITLPSHNRTLCTSGDYEQKFVDAHGKKRHHIINPQTGYPSEYAHSVTVTTSLPGMLPHSLCTWFMTMPLDSVKAITARAQGKIDALVILPDSLYWVTPHLQQNLELQLDSTVLHLAP